MSEKIVQLNEEIIKGQLKELVRGSVEETLNELLEKEAESLTQAARYERSEARQGYRSGHYDRSLVSAIGLGAIAFSGSRLELLDGSLQIGLRSLIARVADLTDEDTLLGRLDIRQTKHLLLAFLGAVS